MRQTQDQQQEVLSALLSRRSVSPKRLVAPGPNRDELSTILKTALRAPDHGRLVPWRIIEFPATSRPALAMCFEQEKLRRDPLAGFADLAKAREHALQSPVLLAFVVSPRAKTQVPLREQLLAAGAALGNLLNAAHALGYGASILSGERCFDADLQAQLGLFGDEWLAGFVGIGRIREWPPEAKVTSPQAVWSQWPSAAPASNPADPARSQFEVLGRSDHLAP